MTIYNYRVPKHVATQGLLATDPLGTATQGFVEIEQLTVIPDISLDGSSLISFTYSVLVDDTALVIDGSTLVSFTTGKKDRGGRGGIPRKKRKPQPHIWAYKPVVLNNDRLEIDGHSIVSFEKAKVLLPSLDFFKSLPAVVPHKEIALNPVEDFLHDLQLFNEEQKKIQQFTISSIATLPRLQSTAEVQFVNFLDVVKEQDNAWLEMELLESSNEQPIIFLTQNSLLSKIKYEDELLLEIF